MKKRLLLSVIAFSSFSYGQLHNSDFEDWSNINQHVYDYEMVDSHLVADPFHGFLTNWAFDYDVGLCQTTDAFTGNYAAIIHNWYSYAQTKLIYRDSFSFYPEHLTGAYKYVDAVPGSVGTAHVIVKSVAGDTIINNVHSFGMETQWTAFDFSLTASSMTSDEADSIIIVFDNSDVNCQTMMTCNLLFLDGINVMKSGTANMNEIEQTHVSVHPNPTHGEVIIEGHFKSAFIFDHMGRVVKQIEQGEKELDLQLDPGMYYIQFEHSGSVSVQELVIR